MPHRHPRRKNATKNRGNYLNEVRSNRIPSPGPEGGPYHQREKPRPKAGDDSAVRASAFLHPGRAGKPGHATRAGPNACRRHDGRRPEPPAQNGQGIVAKGIFTGTSKMNSTSRPPRGHQCHRGGLRQQCPPALAGHGSVLVGNQWENAPSWRCHHRYR